MFAVLRCNTGKHTLIINNELSLNIVALYWIVLDRMEAGRHYLWLLGTCVGIGFALSTQVRCICLLSIPVCCGRAGRAFVSTYVVAYVIEGNYVSEIMISKSFYNYSKNKIKIPKTKQFQFHFHKLKDVGIHVRIFSLKKCFLLNHSTKLTIEFQE